MLGTLRRNGCMIGLVGSMVVCCVLCQMAWGAPGDLILHYNFAEGSGPVVRDQSGRENHARIHGATWAKGAFGSAMRFDGQDDYLDGGIRPDFDKIEVGSIVTWIRPDLLRGGLVARSAGRDYFNSRMVLSFKGSFMAGVVADGKSYAKVYFDDGVIKRDQWAQVAYTFGDSRQVGYVDGVQVDSRSYSLKPEAEGLALFVGRSELYNSGDYFSGLISDLQIYDRALSEDEILDLYRNQGGRMGKDVTPFSRPKVEAVVYPDAERIVVFADVDRMRQLVPQAAVLSVAILRSQDEAAMVEGDAAIRDNHAEVILDGSDLETDSYVVAATVSDRQGQRIGRTAKTTITWQGRSPRIQRVKVLNNFVMALFNQPMRRKEKKATFYNPRHGWVFISLTVDSRTQTTPSISIDGMEAGPLMTRTSNGGGRAFEAIRHLNEGEHEVEIAWDHGGVPVTLVVRAIPEIQYVYYPRNPKIKPHGPYDWQFLSKDVLANITTLVTSTDSPPDLELWKSMGRKWISITSIPAISGEEEAEQVDEARVYWSNAIGMKTPLMGGVIINEFTGGDLPIYEVYRQAVERIYANTNLAGRTVDAYSGILYGSKLAEDFAQAVIAGGGHVRWESYFGEYASRQEASDAFQGMVRKMVQWQEAIPGITERMIIVLGYLEQPTYSTNFHPWVDFKVGMDMQVRLLATHPAFFGLGGLSQWASSYADDETIRWSGRLYRHYCIEGNTEPLSNDPYILTHIQNPDFDEGTHGWTIEAAEPGSAETRTMDGYGYLQARSRQVGNHFLWTRRSARNPNVFSQEIKNLEPDRLYSIKIITADYQNLMNEISVTKTDAVRISLEGVDVDESRSFQFSFPQHYGRVLGLSSEGISFG
jgi:hypothetical protein